MSRIFFSAQNCILVFLWPRVPLKQVSDHSNHVTISATGLECFWMTFGLKTSFSSPNTIVLCPEFFSARNSAFWSFCGSLIYSIGSFPSKYGFQWLECFTSRSGFPIQTDHKNTRETPHEGDKHSENTQRTISIVRTAIFRFGGSCCQPDLNWKCL